MYALGCCTLGNLLTCGVRFDKPVSRTYRTNRKTGKRERDTYHRNTHPSRSCTHGGSCAYCYNNRTFGTKKREPLIFTEEFVTMCNRENLPRMLDYMSGPSEDWTYRDEMEFAMNGIYSSLQYIERLIAKMTEEQQGSKNQQEESE